MTFVYLDIETTGLDPDVHQVWEIAYAIGDGPILSGAVDHTLEYADPMALQVNGYWGRDMIMSNPIFEFDLQCTLEGSTLVGANPAFDAAFLRRRWRNAPWRYRLFDVETYAMPALGLNVPAGLKDIAAELEVTAPDHSAAGDVRTLRECHRKLRTYYSTQPTLPEGIAS